MKLFNFTYSQLIIWVVLIVSVLLVSCEKETYDNVKLNSFEISSDTLNETLSYSVYQPKGLLESKEYPIIILFEPKKIP